MGPDRIIMLISRDPGIRIFGGKSKRGERGFSYLRVFRRMRRLFSGQGGAEGVLVPSAMVGKCRGTRQMFIPVCHMKAMILMIL